MNLNEFKHIIKLHEMCCILKTTLRQGWVSWHVEKNRIESIAEHIFGTCMLAVGIFATGSCASEQKIDINKVIIMLVLHETEEILIGDITPFDNEKNRTKAVDGRAAVLEIFKDFSNSKHFLNIIEEFEANITAEAQFAHQCDKFEADLQALLYEGSYKLEKVADKITRDSRIVNLKSKGYTNVSELFLQNDKPRYKGVFREMANFLEKVEKEKLHEKVNAKK